MTRLILILAIAVSLIGATAAPEGANDWVATTSGQSGSSGIGTALLGGKATYYDDGPGLYGAAGPLLREALGGDPAFRGQAVRVCSEECVIVTLRDWCACGDRGGVPTIIDLSPEAFARLAPLSRGVITVEIELEPVSLPATDTQEGT